MGFRMTKEFLLEPNPDRFLLLPVKYPDLWERYERHGATRWTVQEIDLSKDMQHWKQLDAGARHFLEYVLAFFAAADGIVNENLACNFYREIQLPEARAFYGDQIQIEVVHAHAYALLLETYVVDVERREFLRRSIYNMPAIAKKANWALKWIESDNFVERLIAFAVVEGIFFSGSFAAIFWMRSKGLLPGLTAANEWISRDESYHAEFATHLYNKYVTNKLSTERLKEIVLSALEIEKEFILEALPIKLLGMNSDLMKEYLEFVVDNFMLSIGEQKIFNARQPFSFMNNIAIQSKTNQFEQQETAYTKFGKSSTGATFDNVDLFDFDLNEQF